jgi:hypothetical protein
MFHNKHEPTAKQILLYDTSPLEVDEEFVEEFYRETKIGGIEITHPSHKKHHAKGKNRKFHNCKLVEIKLRVKGKGRERSVQPYLIEHLNFVFPRFE